MGFKSGWTALMRGWVEALNVLKGECLLPDFLYYEVLVIRNDMICVYFCSELMSR